MALVGAANVPAQALTSNGLGTISTTLIAVLKAGDHLCTSATRCSAPRRSSATASSRLSRASPITTRWILLTSSLGVFFFFLSREKRRLVKPNTRRRADQAAAARQTFEMTRFRAIAPALRHRHGALVIERQHMRPRRSIIFFSLWVARSSEYLIFKLMLICCLREYTLEPSTTNDDRAAEAPGVVVL